jgi:hypothetical protein
LASKETFCPFGQPIKARTLDGANVNKYVRPTIVRLNGPKAFLAVERNMLLTSFSRLLKT